MVNEACKASLHAFALQKLFTQKPSAFLHIFTKTPTALLVKSLLLVACEEVRFADREVSRSASKVGILIYRAASPLKFSVTENTRLPLGKPGQ